jgi:hypothetical protein
MFSFREHARRGSSPAVFVGAEEGSPVGACNVRAVRMIAVDYHCMDIIVARGERKNIKISVLCGNKVFLDSVCCAKHRYSCPIYKGVWGRVDCCEM